MKNVRIPFPLGPGGRRIFFRTSLRLRVLVLILAMLFARIRTQTADAFQINHKTSQRCSIPAVSYSNNPHNHNSKKYKRPNQSKHEIQIILQKQFQDLRTLHDGRMQQLQDDEKQEVPHVSLSSLDYSSIHNLEANIHNSIWKSRDVKEVHHILTQFINTAKEIIHQATPPIPNMNKLELSQNDNEEEVFTQLIGPNIAASALRRIIDIRPDFNGRKTNIPSNMEDIKIAKQLLPGLLQAMGREVVHADSDRRVAADLDSHSLEEGHLYTFSNLVASMQILTGSSGSETSEESVQLRRDRGIFKTEMTHVSNANMIYSLAKIKLLQKHNGKYNDETTLKSLAQKICMNIKMKQLGDNNTNNDFTKQTNPLLLIEMLRGLATFNLSKEEYLLRKIGDRLKQGDATGKLNGRQLAMGLWAYASLERPHMGLLKSFSRRLRKANVRSEMSASDISRAIWAVGQSMKQLDFIAQKSSESDFAKFMESSGDDAISDEEVAALREDLNTMLYTLSGELLSPKSAVAGAKTKASGLKLHQMQDILLTFVSFEFDPYHVIVQEFQARIREQLLSNAYEFTPYAVTRILWSFQRLKAPLDEHIIRALLERVHETVISEEAHAEYTPKILNTIMRSVVMILPNHGVNIPELHQILSQKIKDTEFLSQCNEFECSNFIWILAMTKCYDKELMKLISDRMRSEDIIESLTPSSASRFLWSFTSLVENNAEDFDMKEILYESFQTYGGILLSAKLTPVDSSSAMWAMAKSSYSLDMGIFDHLAKVLAVEFMLSRATIQQIAEALWSCGKMISWEDFLMEKMEYGEFTPPPYVESGKYFAAYLASCSGNMSPKDISQSIWAIGRLKITDPEIINPLADMAKVMATNEEFNSQEIANILWALSKVDFDDVETVSKLTEQIQRPMILESTSPQEAANVLYALGKMGIRDAEAFSSMNTVLMRQLDSATTQTIANALWAHDTVNLQPPRQLFDSWAKEKLDIVGLYLDNQQVEIIQHSSSVETEF